MVQDQQPAHSPIDIETSAFQWWEKRRILYNLCVGFSGVAAILAFADGFNAADAVGLVMYGIIANLFYFLGQWVELADRIWLDGRMGMVNFRLALFVIGTAGSMILTMLTTVLYYYNTTF